MLFSLSVIFTVSMLLIILGSLSGINELRPRSIGAALFISLKIVWMPSLTG